jgi:hypothetical protein
VRILTKQTSPKVRGSAPCVDSISPRTFVARGITPRTMRQALVDPSSRPARICATVWYFAVTRHPDAMTAKASIVRVYGCLTNRTSDTAKYASEDACEEGIPAVIFLKSGALSGLGALITHLAALVTAAFARPPTARRMLDASWKYSRPPPTAQETTHLVMSAPVSTTVRGAHMKMFIRAIALAARTRSKQSPCMRMPCAGTKAGGNMAHIYTMLAAICAGIGAASGKARRRHSPAKGRA